MADVEEPALSKAAAAARRGTARPCFPCVTDVADRAAVGALRDAALSAFGAVHVVCNNAGVGGPHGPLWECPPGEWDWVLGVNLEGVMNGVRAFMPVLLEQDAGHLLNTSSIFGVFAGTLGPYGVSKHAVTALTETLHFNLGRSASPCRRLRAVPGRGADQLRHLGRNRPPWAGPRRAEHRRDQDEAERASAERFDELSLLGPPPRTSPRWWLTGSGRVASTSSPRTTGTSRCCAAARRSWRAARPSRPCRSCKSERAVSDYGRTRVSRTRSSC